MRAVLVGLLVPVLSGCPCPVPHPVPDACVAVRAEPPDGGCANDEYEPNRDLALAAAPAMGSACGGDRLATIAGDSDVDVFRTGLCSSQTPWASLDRPDLQLCVFPICHDGWTNIDDCYEQTPGDSVRDAGPPTTWFARTEGGFRGCCGVGVSRVTAKVSCGTISLSTPKIDTFLWIDPGDAESFDECRAYRVTFQMP